MDRRTDTEGYNIIPRHTLVAGYKKSKAFQLCFNAEEVKGGVRSKFLLACWSATLLSL